MDLGRKRIEREIQAKPPNLFYSDQKTWTQTLFQSELRCTMWCLKRQIQAVWPDWAIFSTLGNFFKPLATINFSQSSPVLVNFCKGVKIMHFLVKPFLGNFYRHLAILPGHTGHAKSSIFLCKPHSHPYGFYWGYLSSWTLIPANIMQVSNMQSDNCNRN